MAKIYVLCNLTTAKELAQWLRETYVFEGPNSTRDGYYHIESGGVTIEFLRDDKMELFLRLKLAGTDCEII